MQPLSLFIPVAPYVLGEAEQIVDLDLGKS